MTYDELSDEQKVQVKKWILEKRKEQCGEGTSWEELANADALVPEEEAEEWCRGICFVTEDFEHSGRVYEAQREAMKHTVSMAVDGRIDVDAAANYPQEASRKAKDKSMGFDPALVEVVGSHPVNCKDENGNLADA